MSAAGTGTGSAKPGAAAGGARRSGLARRLTSFRLSSRATCRLTVVWSRPTRSASSTMPIGPSRSITASIDANAGRATVLTPMPLSALL